MRIKDSIETGTRFYPEKKSPPPRYCACGTRLSRYQKDDQCYPCQAHERAA